MRLPCLCNVTLLTSGLVVLRSTIVAAEVSSLHAEIIKAMMPPISTQCARNATYTSYDWYDAQAKSQWDTTYGAAGFERNVFLAEMNHTDPSNPNQEWTIRIGSAGNIYSMIGKMGETVPPQRHNKAPFIDEVWQCVAPIGSNGDHDNDPSTNPNFIHEAGTYQKDAPYTDTPFYSPSLGSYCEDDQGECGFIGWGQQAHLPTHLKSSMLYMNRYVNCGDGVIEHTAMFHSINGNQYTIGYKNFPWGGTRDTVLKDVVLTNSANEHTVLYPIPSWAQGQARALKNTAGYTVFAEDLPAYSANHGDPHNFADDGITNSDFTLQRSNADCKKSGVRFRCPLVQTNNNNNLAPNMGYPGRVVTIQGNETSFVAGVRHWAYNGNDMYIYKATDNQIDTKSLAEINAILPRGSTIVVTKYSPGKAGKPEADNLALAHVHGGTEGNGNYPRVRYGYSSRDYNVYTINSVTQVRGGDTLARRQYFILDEYLNIKNNKGQYWAPEASETKYTASSAPNGKTVTLYSNGVDTFGYALDGASCTGPAATQVCQGNTTPSSNTKPLFQVKCSTYKVSDDLYVFAPSYTEDPDWLGDPIRPYVCNDNWQQRPQWTLLGFFDTSCSSIASGFQLNNQYCNAQEISSAPSTSPTAAPSSAPTTAPSSEPTVAPSTAPTISLMPSSGPSSAPTQVVNLEYMLAGDFSNVEDEEICDGMLQGCNEAATTSDVVGGCTDCTVVERRNSTSTRMLRRKLTTNQEVVVDMTYTVTSESSDLASLDQNTINEGFQNVTNQTITSFGCYDEECPSQSPSSSPSLSMSPSSAPSKLSSPSSAPSPTGVKGDPHFTTWAGEKFDFHGVCDLVLLQNHKFKGIGMDIHIRTTKTHYWSYVSSTVIRIGEDTLEVSGSKGKNRYWINKVEGDAIEDDELILPTTIGGFPVKFIRLSNVAQQFIIELEAEEQIDVKTWNAMVSINIKGGKKQDFGHSLGLMGSFDHGLLIGRDNQTIIKNLNKFGLEWQVKEYEPMLFHNMEGPQAPTKCGIPSSAEMRRRLSQVQVSKSDAVIACKHVYSQDFDHCIFDVMATNDLNVADAY